MRRVHFTEVLGISDGAVFALFGIAAAAYVGMMLVSMLKDMPKEKRKKIRTGALVVAGMLVIAAVAVLLFTRTLPIKNAEKLMAQGQYTEAIEAFRKLDLPERVREAQTAHAGAMVEAGDYEAAADLYKELGMESERCGALVGLCRNLLDDGQTEQAAETIRSVALMPEAAQLIRENDALKDAVFAPGSLFTLGCKVREPRNLLEKQKAFDWAAPLEEANGLSYYGWNVLEYVNGKVLLLSTPLGGDAMFSSYYDLPEEDAYELSWEKSNVRAKLNEEVYESFTDQVREAIVPTTLTTDSFKLEKSYRSRIKEHLEVVTEDMLFLLDCEQTQRYLAQFPHLLTQFEYWGKFRFWTNSVGTLTSSDTYMKRIVPGENGRYTIEDAEIFTNQAIRAAMWIDVDRLLQPN